MTPPRMYIFVSVTWISEISESNVDSDGVIVLSALGLLLETIRKQWYKCKKCDRHTHTYTDGHTNISLWDIFE